LGFDLYNSLVAQGKLSTTLEVRLSFYSFEAKSSNVFEHFRQARCLHAVPLAVYSDLLPQHGFLLRDTIHPARWRAAQSGAATRWGFPQAAGTTRLTFLQALTTDQTNYKTVFEAYCQDVRCLPVTCAAAIVSLKPMSSKQPRTVAGKKHKIKY